MNKRDLMLHVLTQVLNMPVKHLEKVLDVWEDFLGQEIDWEEEVPSGRRPEFEAKLLADREGIVVRYQRLLQNHPELLEDRHQTIQQDNAKKNRKVRRR